MTEKVECRLTCSCLNSAKTEVGLLYTRCEDWPCYAFSVTSEGDGVFWLAGCLRWLPFLLVCFLSLNFRVSFLVEFFARKFNSLYNQKQKSKTWSFLWSLWAKILDYVQVFQKEKAMEHAGYLLYFVYWNCKNLLKWNLMGGRGGIKKGFP